jgi:hypothetical protein
MLLYCETSWLIQLCLVMCLADMGILMPVGLDTCFFSLNIYRTGPLNIVMHVFHINVFQVVETL